MRFGTWCLGVGVVLAGSSVIQGDEGVEVAIQGAPGTEFNASWSLVPADGGRRLEGHWEGEVPRRYTLPAGRLDLTLMQVSARGHIEVVVTAGGNRSRSLTHGRGSRMRLSVH